MKNKVILLKQCVPITGHHTSDAGLIGTMSVHFDENEEEQIEKNVGMLGGSEDIILYDRLLRRERLSLFLQKNIIKKMVHGTLEYERKANVTIEVELIQLDVMDILVKRSQIIKSDLGLEFHFNVDDAGNEIPDVMPCPFCGYAAHFDEDVYGSGHLNLMCDSKDKNSCGETLTWETIKGEDVESK